MPWVEDWNDGCIVIGGGRVAKMQRFECTLVVAWSQSLGRGSIDRAREVEQACDPWR